MHLFMPSSNLHVCKIYVAFPLELDIEICDHICVAKFVSVQVDFLVFEGILPMCFPTFEQLFSSVSLHVVFRADYLHDECCCCSGYILIIIKAVCIFWPFGNFFLLHGKTWNWYMSLDKMSPLPEEDLDGVHMW